MLLVLNFAHLGNLFELNIFCGMLTSNAPTAHCCYCSPVRIKSHQWAWALVAVQLTQVRTWPFLHNYLGSCTFHSCTSLKYVCFIANSLLNVTAPNNRASQTDDIKVPFLTNKKSNGNGSVQAEHRSHHLFTLDIYHVTGHYSTMFAIFNPRPKIHLNMDDRFWYFCSCCAEPCSFRSLDEASI